jgi:hypothetical protein
MSYNLQASLLRLCLLGCAEGDFKKSSRAVTAAAVGEEKDDAMEDPVLVLPVVYYITFQNI